jgi:hypothetical protein
VVHQAEVAQLSATLTQREIDFHAAVLREQQQQVPSTTTS